jgi:hypothetical protein
VCCGIRVSWNKRKTTAHTLHSTRLIALQEGDLVVVTTAVKDSVGWKAVRRPLC